MVELTIEQKIMERVMKDPAFRQALKNDPKAALEGAFGLKFPESIKIMVHEETDELCHIVIPAEQKTQTAGLTQDQLDKVVGGWTLATYPGRILTAEDQHKDW